MKITALLVLKINASSDQEDPIILANASDVSHFGALQRSTVKEFIVFVSRTVAKRTPPGQPQSVQHSEYKVHAYNRGGLCALGFTDDHYPVRSAFSLLNKVLDEYQKNFGESWRTINADSNAQPWPYLTEALSKYQDPAEADKLLKIQRELDEAKIILTLEMSVAADSSSSSSSEVASDDLEALLDRELGYISSDEAPKEEGYDSRDSLKRTKRCKIDFGSTAQVGTSSSFEQKTEVGTSSSFEQKTEVARQVSCAHAGGVFRGMCIECGEKIEDAAGIVLGYIHKDLILGKDEITRVRNAEFKKMLQKKKLYLVIDLDHTVLNSTRFEDISPDEEYVMSQAHSLQGGISDGSLFRLDKIQMVTKLRPFVRKFLKEASELFEMYIYTMGEQSYAYEMANLLDPGGSYFNSRIISQGDCTQKHQKGLDVVLGNDSAVIVLDDTEAVWQKHMDNVILMDRYHFFHESHRHFELQGKSLSELKIDESEEDGLLATILGVLRHVHSSFFDPEREDDVALRDVREVLKRARKEVLKECKIVLSHIIPVGVRARDNRYWKMAEKLGATCCEEVDPSVTHVVSLSRGTHKSKWALKENKFLVHPQWIEAALYLWKRQPEDKFPVLLDQ